ncbi:sucrose permease [Klebsiella pneumoniae]|uniref:Sucrose permease n=1 Tax=Klebsiella pneumoniae TaxID=573 RepID=A0A378A940_KLEPN|nr:sucrose permease [Klebsiella pneumoniae]
MQEAVSGGKVTLEDALRLLTLPRLLGAGLLRHRHLHLRRSMTSSSRSISHRSFATLQEGNEMYGYLNSFQVFLEAAGMFCAPWLVNRIGAKNGLIFAGMVMAMRMVASRSGGGAAADLHHQTAARGGVADTAGGYLLSTTASTSINVLSSTLYLVGFGLHQLDYRQRIVAAGGLQL